jgi:hypothetical protein
MPVTLCPENQYSPQLACPLRILQSSIIAYALAEVAYARRAGSTRRSDFVQIRWQVFFNSDTAWHEQLLG